MADGALTLTLDDATIARLADAADRAGLTPEAYAAERLAEAVQPAPHDWTEAARRLADYDRTGAFVTFEDWATGFKADVQSRLDARS